MTSEQHLVLACAALVALTFAVGMRMLYCRVREMRARRLRPDAVARSGQMAAALTDTQAADNFRNLFEVPVLFYALCGLAVGSGHVPAWLVAGAWAFVALRAVHSAIHLTTNRVMHRLAAFAGSFALLVALWFAFAATLPARALS